MHRKSFFDIAFPEDKVRLIDHVASMADQVERERFRQVFSAAALVLEQINRRYAGGAVFPEVFVTKGDAVGAEVAEGRLILTEGLLRYLAELRYPDLARVMDPAGIDALALESLVPVCSMMWTLAHEHFHVVRRHEAVHDKYGRSLASLRATEVDADLCAVAEVYRFLQFNLGKGLPDLNIRLLTLYSVFWVIRSFPASVAEGSHPSIAERLHLILLKLAMVPEVDGELPDVDFARPETRDRSRALRDVLIGCEREFQRLGVADAIEPGGLMAEMVRMIDSKTVEALLDEWANMKALVAAASGTRA